MIRKLHNVWAPVFFLPLLASCGDFEPEAVNVGYASSAIANGTVDEDDTYTVGILAYDGGLCSGSLIAPNVVLTARHCIAKTSPGYVQCGQSPFGADFQAGRVFVTTDTKFNYQGGGNWYGVREIRTPTTGNDTCGYDVALLVLSSNVPASEATPVNPRIDSPPERGELYTAIGYGMTCDSQKDNCPQGKSGTRRRQDGLTVQCTRGKCSPASQVKASEWNGERDVCSGDSGGPALDSLGRVIGVASRGGGMGGKCVYPIYAGVDPWRDMIIQAALDGAQFGGYAPPKWATTGDSTQDLPPFDPGEPPTQGGAGGSGGTGGTGGNGDVDEPDAGPADPEPEVDADIDDALACAADADCLEGEDCREGQCIASCTTGNPCGEGSSCNLDTGACDRVAHGDPSADAIEDAPGSWNCSMSQSTDPTKPVPWLLGLAMIPALRRLRSRKS